MIQIKNLRKTFNPDTAYEKKALRGVTLGMDKGEFLVVIGGNGSGKSTILNAIAGVFFPDDGEIVIDGTAVTGLPEYERAKYIGRVFQDPMIGVAPNMNIYENMALAARRGRKRTFKSGLHKSEKSRYKELVASLGLGLEDRMKAKTGLLSGGQRQAVTLLMATIQKPAIFLLDEHTAALDPKTAAVVMELSDKLVREENLTTLMVTHNMKDACKYGDRIIMMDSGKIVYEVSKEQKNSITSKELIERFDIIAEMNNDGDDDD